MKDDGHVARGPLEIFAAKRDIAIYQAYIVGGQPLENACLANEAAHAPATRKQRLDKVASDESRRACDKRDTPAVTHFHPRRPGRRTIGTCGMQTRPSFRSQFA